jgi:hypothetical protein
MHYVTHHLNRHHLLHAPHRWFLALLLSPIHALEVHYQKHYHLQFAHARKLFLFDMLLLASTFVIAGAGLFWYTYDPTIQKKVKITITPQATDEQTMSRVPSGQQLLFVITYSNSSQKLLEDPTIHINMPPGVVITEVMNGIYTSSTHAITVPPIKPRETGTVILTGQFFGAPDVEYSAGAELVYRQKNNTNFEAVTNAIITTLRGSVLVGNVQAPSLIFGTDEWDTTLSITNSYHTPIKNISVPIISDSTVTFRPGTPTIGSISAHEWSIAQLDAGQQVALPLHVHTKIAHSTTTFSLVFTPTITVNNASFNQQKITATAAVVHPLISIDDEWIQSAVTPGTVGQLKLKIKNNGSIALRQAQITIPLPTQIIGVSATGQKNNAPIAGGSLVISSKQLPELALIEPNKSITTTIQIPINAHPVGGTDLQLPLNVRISGLVDGVTRSFTYEHQIVPLRVGTSLQLNATARYYSIEGDQLGRGPLPPRTGKETKYWAFITLANGTSAISDASISAVLAPGVTWTGKSSVSNGHEPMYIPNSRTLRWSTSGLAPGQTVHINCELAITPTDANKGTIPLLLTSLQTTAFDTYIQQKISEIDGSLDASLPHDPIAQEKGVRID